MSIQGFSRTPQWVIEPDPKPTVLDNVRPGNGGFGDTGTEPEDSNLPGQDHPPLTQAGGSGGLGPWSEQPMHDALAKNKVTGGDVGIGLGTAVGATVLTTIAGGVAGMAIGGKGGSNTGAAIGLFGGLLAGLGIGAGAGLAAGGTILAKRDGHTDLTRPVAIAGAIGGAAAVAIMARSFTPSGIAAVGLGGAVGGLVGAAAGSIAD
jgi:hypothetical protein